MESNRYLKFFIFGISMLPKIYTDIFPPLVLTKEPYTYYVLADKLEYIEGQDDVVTFSILPQYPIYNACPEENAPHHRTYALKVEELVTVFQARPLDKFVKGFLNRRYNCSNPIKPIVLKYADPYNDKFPLEEGQKYDIGFLIHEEGANFPEIGLLYEDLIESNEYDFINFLTITMDKSSGSIFSVRHVINSGQLLEPDLAYSGPFQPNEKNTDVYGFDVDSLYTEENQAKIFSSIFPLLNTLYYSHPNKSLQKVQLAPHEDFLLNTWKLSSFMDLNTAGMWVQLLPQWKKIELLVRKVARELETLTIETGTAKILELTDANHHRQLIYLREGKKSPAPLYFWKVIKFKQFYEKAYINAILIVMHNDPYTPNQEPICNVGNDFGWTISNTDYKTGLTYVCPVDENITSKLHDKFKVKYDIFKLNNLPKLVYDEKRKMVTWVSENVNLKILIRSLTALRDPKTWLPHNEIEN